MLRDRVWKLWSTLVKASAFTIEPILLSAWFQCVFCFSFCYFIAECAFPPKIRTTILGAILVQRRIKALGGIKLVINPISTDSILVDHMTLLPMGSIGWHLEVIIIHWNVLRWSWGPNSDRQSLDFFFHLNVILLFFSCFKTSSSSGKTEKNLLWIIFQSACLFFVKRLSVDNPLAH